MKATLYRNIVILVYVFLLPLVGFAQRAGDLDRSFNSGSGANRTVITTAVQADGKIIIGGAFTTYNGTSRNYIARLNTDGSLDTTFNPGTGADGFVRIIILQSDGKIIIGGSFTSFNGTSRNYIARLNSNGSLDDTFNPGTGANCGIYSIALQANGKIIIGGCFTSFNGTTRYGIARLNANGSLDGTFNSGFVAGDLPLVATIVLQPNGKIIIGGDFFYTQPSGLRNTHIARVNSDGSLDVTFNPRKGANGYVYSTAVQANGKILIRGAFTSFNGTTRYGIARLNANGSLDDTFNPGTGANCGIYTIALQANGKIIIGGCFTSYNGTTRNRIARLYADGSLDATFNTAGTGAERTVNTITVQSDGKILIGGDFTFYNGTERNRIARLNANGSLDATF